MDTKKLNKILDSEIKDHGVFKTKNKAPRITAKNGVSLSVQASEDHYCSPRENKGPYYEVEVGFPSIDPPDSWESYFDGCWDTHDRKQSVYGYVPIDMVVDFINENGGLGD